jgi:hypothetical protein
MQQMLVSPCHRRTGQSGPTRGNCVLRLARRQRPESERNRTVMSGAYQLPPAHRRKLRRMRALVETATSRNGTSADGAATAGELAEATAYLVTHSTCEAYLLAQPGDSPPERPRCAQGHGKRARVKAPSQTRKCPVCSKLKSVLSFDDELGVCIKCKYRGSGSPKGRKNGGGSGTKAAPTRSRKCPVCLQRVNVTLFRGEWTVESHKKTRAEGLVECRGSGQVLFRERRDAMDHTVPGNFEGGKRR